MTLQIQHDPRNPLPEAIVHTESSHPSHDKLRKTLVLLAIDTKEDPIYFVVEGLAEGGIAFTELQEREEYFYEEHTCPTNFIRIPMISQGGDTDPHGVFRFVEAIWMTCEYEDCEKEGCVEDYLTIVFPQTAINDSKGSQS